MGNVKEMKKISEEIKGKINEIQKETENQEKTIESKLSNHQEAIAKTNDEVIELMSKVYEIMIQKESDKEQNTKEKEEIKANVAKQIELLEQNKVLTDNAMKNLYQRVMLEQQNIGNQQQLVTKRLEWMSSQSIQNSSDIRQIYQETQDALNQTFCGMDFFREESQENYGRSEEYTIIDVDAQSESELAIQSTKHDSSITREHLSTIEKIYCIKYSELKLKKKPSNKY
ncbi:hypothetical protein QTN25_008086 [Entamoeba marina]